MKLKVINLMTPPLLPILGSGGDFPECVGLSDLQTSSEPSSRISEDLKAMESDIFASLAQSSDTVELPSSPPMAGPQTLVQLDQLKSKNERVADLKLEAPILPQHPRVPSPFPPLGETVDLSSWSEQDFLTEEEIQSTFRDMACSVEQAVKEGKLDPRDALARIPVPQMNFTIPDVAWKKHCRNAKEMQDWILLDASVLESTPTWHRDKAAEAELEWIPIPAGSWNLVRCEPVECPLGTLEDLLVTAKEQTLLTSAEFVRQPRDGIQCTAMAEDGDADLVSTLANTSKVFSRGNDTAVPGKRREAATIVNSIEGEESDPTVPLLSPKPPTTDLAAIARKRKRELCGTEEQEQQKIKPKRNREAAMVGDADTNNDLLASYLEGRGKQARLLHAPYFGPPRQKALVQPARSEELVVKDEKMMPPPPKPLPAPVPRIPAPNRPVKVVASINLSKQTWEKLSELLPGITFIERDYNSYNTSIWISGNVRAQEIKSPLTEEADIIVSPGTGIILTTLVWVRQKPQPGTKGKSMFWNRIQKISARYERLVVLVSEGSNRETVMPLGSADAKGLAEFQGFAAGLPSDVSVMYVAGGELTLTTWAAAVIANYAGEGSEVQDLLVDSETWWELFLRRAGLNIYAAQVILSLLKMEGKRWNENQHGRTDDTPSQALPLFVQMSREQRITRFEGLLGGRRVLERVSKTLESKWSGDRRRLPTPHKGRIQGYHVA